MVTEPTDQHGGLDNVVTKLDQTVSTKVSCCSEGSTERGCLHLVYEHISDR